MGFFLICEQGASCKENVLRVFGGWKEAFAWPARIPASGTRDRFSSLPGWVG